MRKNWYVPKLLLAMLLAFSFSLAYGSGTKSVPVGAALPDFKTDAPCAVADREYLGLKNSEPFALSDVSAKLIILHFTAVL